MPGRPAPDRRSDGPAVPTPSRSGPARLESVSRVNQLVLRHRGRPGFSGTVPSSQRSRAEPTQTDRADKVRRRAVWAAPRKEVK